MPRIDISVFTHLMGRSVDDTEKDLQKRLSKAGGDAGNNFTKEFERSLNAGNPRIRRAAEQLADATAVVAQNNRLRALSEQRVAEASRATANVEERLAGLRRDGQGVSDALAREENRLSAARRSSLAAEREFVRDTSNFERAAARRASAIKNLAEAQANAHRSSGGGGGGGRGGGLGGTLGGIFTSIPFVPGGKAGAVIGTGLITGLGAIAEAVTTASQALWLLPAATAAAGAGFATLKIGFSGFDKALKDMGDPKKWAEDLAKLSPAAQQAALEIQHLVGGLDSIKNLVQQSLFAGVAQQLHGLGNTFMPSIRQMFTGISGAFNEMFQGATNQLMSPQTSAGIANVIHNIVIAFQNLAPAMAPVIDAFVKITQVGSTFLPGLGSSITDLAKRFDDFITRAQQTGQLQHWIEQGLDAAKELGRFLGELAHKFYDVFGGKSPQQFSQTLHGIVGTLTVIGQGIAGLSQVVNGLIRDLQPVARALGGWPNLIRDVIAIWATWKVGGLIADLMNVAKILGVTLPEAAATGAGRITAALATVAMPAWIATFLALWNLHGDSPGTSASTANDKQIAGNRYAKDHNNQMPKGYQQWLQGTGPMPKELGPLYHPGEKPPGKGAAGGPDGRGPAGTPEPGQNPDWYYDSWWGQAPNSAGMGPWSPYDVPAVPEKGGKKGIGADKDATPFGPDYAAPPRPGETEGEYSAEGAVMDAKHRLEQDRGTLLNLQKDNNATAEEKQAQENKIAKDQREIYEAQMRLSQAQESAYKKNLKGLKDADDEFNNIDQDFGLSKGLPGLVKNLVGMLGDMAAAPLMGQLKATVAATGTDKNTFGMLGMMGQQNMAAGKSPLFGIPAGQPGGLAALSPQQYNAIYGGSAGYGAGSGISTMPSIGPMAGAGPASIAPGVTTAGYANGGAGAQLVGAKRPMGGGQNWDALAAKESSGNWGINTGNGYFGGLQFDQSTWNAYKPAGAPSNPAMATKEQQIQAGQTAIAARGGPQSLWPQNYGQLGVQPVGSGADDTLIGPHMSHRNGSYPDNMGIQPPSGKDQMPQGNGLQPGPAFTQLPGATQYGPNGGYGVAQQTGDQLYHSPHRPWSAQYDPYQPGGSWLGSGDGGGGGIASPSGYGSDGGPGGGFGGFTKTGPYNGPDASGQFPQWVKDLGARFHLTPSTYGGHQTGNRNEPGFVPNPGGANRGIDWNGSPQDEEAFADFARQNPGLFEQFIHNDPASGTKTGIAGGRLVGPGTNAPGYYGGDWGGHGDHDHTRFGQGFMFPDGPLQGPGAIPGSDMSTDASGAVVGYGGVPRGPQQAQLTGFGQPDPTAGGPGGQPDPSAPGGTDAPPKPLDAPRGGGWQPQGGGANGIGGLPLAAISSAAGMFPGGGAAAQTAMQLANRTIGYGQQAAAIGVQGLMDTFKISSPDGDDGGKSDLSQGWFGRVAAGFAGARPAIPSGAGATPKAKKDSKPTDDPEGKDALGQGGGGDINHYGSGINISGGNVQFGAQQQPGMNNVEAGHGEMASTPATTSFGGFI